jgi:peptidoglycan-associated lipoprotein
MKLLPIVIILFLSACSTSMFKDNDSQTSAKVENRSNIQENANKATDKVTATVNADPVVTVEVSKQKIDNVNPNTLFKEYSIYFDYDDYTIKEKFLPIVKQHAEFLAKNPNYFIFVEGHTDERGGTEYNLALGQKRAYAVKTALVIYGARENQIEAYSYGATKPKVEGSNEEAWSQNRRTDLVYKN